MSIDSSPNLPHSEWYEELCALAAIGEISGSEFEELQAHMTDCGICRELSSDFRHLTSTDIGSAAILKRGEQSEQATNTLDERALLMQLLDRAGRERKIHDSSIAIQLAATEGVTFIERMHAVLFWLRRPALSYGSVALIVCVAAAVGAYRLREAQLTPTIEGLSLDVRTWMERAKVGETKSETVARELQRSESERQALHKALSEAEERYSELREEEKNLRYDLTAANSQIAQNARTQLTAKAADEEKDKRLADLQYRLEAAVKRTAEQELIAENLRNKLEKVQQSEKSLIANVPEAQGFGDAEAKQLFGARDLHIVDVYDVDSKGQTQRTYGRVYYVQKKLLIFYAFDLQDKKHNRVAAGFQAWGYRQPNENRPENLGLFNIDDASTNRWVLKVNNPRVLEHIDAVFVTLEPSDGSASPQGRRLMYANLAGPANHP